MSGKYGVIKEGKSYEEREFEWKLTDISSVFEREIKICFSPYFDFGGTPWYLVLSPNIVHPGFICLTVVNLKRPETFVEHTFCVKKQDGSVENFGREIVGEGVPCYWLSANHLELSEFKQRKSELAPLDVLTLIFTLKRGTRCSHQPNVLHRPILKRLTNLVRLSQNFKDLFTDKESCDVTLRVEEKQFNAHRLVLAARSSVFAAMLRHDMSEKQTGIIAIPDCDADSFQEFLEYLYCGQLENISFSSAVHLYSTSDKYDVQDLKELCAEYLMCSLTVENMCEVVIMADKYGDTKLFSLAQDFFNRNINKIVDTSGWDLFYQDNIRLAKKLLKEISSKVEITD